MSLWSFPYAVKYFYGYIPTKICCEYFNPLIANPTKWSNTLKQFVGKSRRIV